MSDSSDRRVLPRIPELMQVLDALVATPSQRARCLYLLDVPRHFGPAQHRCRLPKRVFLLLLPSFFNLLILSVRGLRWVTLHALE